MKTLITAFMLMVPIWNLVVDACEVNDGQFIQIIIVEEELEVGTVIGELALDNPAAVQHIKVSEGNNYFDFKKMEGTGKYSFLMKQRVDADTGVNRLQTMLLSCTTSIGLSLEIEIEFEIMDINDHKPKFLPSNVYNFTLSEDKSPGVQVGVIKATDGDIKNSYIDYDIMDASTDIMDLFSLQSVNGGFAIKLVSSLDYERTKEYHFKIIAKDCQDRRDCSLGQKTSTAEVNIQVEDADDLSPEFEQSSYRAVISEETSNGDLILQVKAEDKDVLNHELYYSLAGEGSEYFSIDKFNGKITVSDKRGLEAGKNFLLQAKAAQVTDSNKKDTATIFLSVVAVDAGMPKFTERKFDITVSEYAVVNRSILSMGLIYDQQPAMYSIFTTNLQYVKEKVQPLSFEVKDSVADTQEYFRIGNLISNTVDLVLLQPLDYEVAPLHILTIKAFNNDHSDQVEVTIRVRNENDNSPEFNQPSYTFSTQYAENGIVGRVKATDADQRDGDIKYRLLQSEKSQLFSIDESGVIYLSGPASEYTKQELTLLVEAVDDGKPPRAATAAILVKLSGLAMANSDSQTKDDEETGLKVGNLTIYVIIGVVALVLVVAIIAVTLVCRSRLRSKDKTTHQSNDNNNVDRNEESCSPLFTKYQSARDCTYRDMDDLKGDEMYKASWRGSIASTELDESATLMNPRSHRYMKDISQQLNYPGSDSGHSTGNESRDSPITNSIIDSTSCKTGSPKRGVISTCVQDYRDRQAALHHQQPGSEQTGILQAPAQFRETVRPSSPTASVSSEYAFSMTSDYGSTFSPTADTHSHVKANFTNQHSPTTIIAITPKKTHKNATEQSDEATFNEAVSTKAFPTFHGNVV